MTPARDVAITGMGVVSPIGIGSNDFWVSLVEGRCGIGSLGLFNGSGNLPQATGPPEVTGLPLAIGGRVRELQAKRHVKPRKALKVMSRDIQLAYVAADLACGEAELATSQVAPDRFGIVFGADMIAADLDELVDAYLGCMVDGRFDFSLWGDRALPEMFPLWMLKYLPNMPACHVGIAHDSRGPNNTITLAEVSSLSAVAEAARVIQRGQADVMIAGGASSQIHPNIWARSKMNRPSRWAGDPAAACRPFDADRDGMVYGEGAGAFVLEASTHAKQRGANVLATIGAYANTFEPHRTGELLKGSAIRSGIRSVLSQGRREPSNVGHVNAHGLSDPHDDRIEAQAIRHELGDVPVTAPKSFFGNLGAGTGAVEMAASVLALVKGYVPPTLNYERPDPECPIRVIRGEPAKIEKPCAVLLNQARSGQAVAMLLTRGESSA